MCVRHALIYDAYVCVASIVTVLDSRNTPVFCSCSINSNHSYSINSNNSYSTNSNNSYHLNNNSYYINICFSRSPAALRRAWCDIGEMKQYINT